MGRAYTASGDFVLTYQRFVTADGQTVHAVEQVESSDAALGIFELSGRTSPNSSPAR
jgi:hypothetical protein